MFISQIKMLQIVDIIFVNFGGGVNVGEVMVGSKVLIELGIVIVNGGDVLVVVVQNFDVNQLWVFIFGQGNLLMWLLVGNIDVGCGVKIVIGVLVLVLRLDDQGYLIFDILGLFSGFGIVVLLVGNDLDLYVFMGEINVGEVGICVKGNVFFGVECLVNVNDIQVIGSCVGVMVDVLLSVFIVVLLMLIGVVQVVVLVEVVKDKDEWCC